MGNVGQSGADASLTPAQVEEPEGPDLWHYLEVIRKRKWIIVATVAVVVTLAVVYTLQQTPIYQGTASAVVNPRAPQIFGSEIDEVVQLGSENQWSTEEYHNTQVEILESYDAAERTVRRHDLQNDPRLFPGEEVSDADSDARVAHASRALADGVSAGMRHGSRILDLHVRHPDPEVAADLANAHIETYIHDSLDSRAQYSEEASEFLARELDDAEQALREAEEALADFKSDNEILTVSVDDRLNIVADDLERYTAALREARIERIELGTVLQQVREAEDIEDVLESPVAALTGSDAMKELKERYHAERRELMEMSGALGPRHPERMAQHEKLEDLRESVEREKRLAARELEDQYAAMRENERQFQARVEDLKRQALALDRMQLDFDRLSRAQGSAEDNYELVRNRLRDSQLSQRNHFGNIEPNTSARVPSAPVEPDMVMNVGLAAALGLFLGLGLAFGREYMDRTIRSPEDIEQHAGAPLLGVVPGIDDDDLPSEPEARTRGRDLYVFEHPSSHAAECARSIRTNILFSGASRELKVITLVSPSPRDGKTTSVVHLGTTMAQSGQRVLLIDSDLRKPRLHKAVNVARGGGISSVIVGESSRDEAIQETEIPNLHVLPCGPTPPNPAELLMTQQFRELIGELRGMYDRIILDSPPLQAVTDASVLSRMSDGAILVAKARKTLRDELARTAKQLREVDAHVLGVILNDLDLSDRKYGYYHYAYGYGEESDRG